jgi:ApaG protein
MYSETTQNVTVTVVPTFLPDQSEPESSKFFWAYTIRIQNSGQTQEVKGAGVVGEQPVLGPGESFEYTSGAPLPTPSGFMVGSYEMATQGGRHFDVGIPAFSLDSPHGQQQIH